MNVSKPVLLSIALLAVSTGLWMPHILNVNMVNLPVDEEGNLLVRIIEPEEPPPPPSVWEEIVKRGYMRVGTSPDWPPYEYLDEMGNLIGFEVDLTEMIAERLDIEVEWIEMSFDAIVPSVQAGDIDLGVSGFSVTPQRLEVVQFTMPHIITEGQIIMLNSTRTALGITEIDSLANLTDLGLTCGTGVGTTQEEELQNEAPAALVIYVDCLAALDDMKIGAIDCVYAETPLTSWWVLEAEEAGEEPIVIIYRRPYWPVAFVAHLDSDILVAKINGALAEIISEGKLDELKAQWKC